VPVLLTVHVRAQEIPGGLLVTMPAPAPYISMVKLATGAVAAGWAHESSPAANMSVAASRAVRHFDAVTVVMG